MLMCYSTKIPLSNSEAGKKTLCNENTKHNKYILQGEPTFMGRGGFCTGPNDTADKMKKNFEPQSPFINHVTIKSELEQTVHSPIAIQKENRKKV